MDDKDVLEITNWSQTRRAMIEWPAIIDLRDFQRWLESGDATLLELLRLSTTRSRVWIRPPLIMPGPAKRPTAKIVSSASLKAINEELIQAERKLTSLEGLLRRPWMEHLIYATGWYTGYGPETMPGPREAIEERRYGTPPRRSQE